MKKEYMTCSKKCLLDFLSSHPDSQFTVEQIYESISSNANMGKSTVYRLIDRMVNDGTVRRFVPDNSRHFLYQYSGCHSPHSHLHLKCTSCGCLLHMEDKQSEEMLSRILKMQDFELDGEKTLLYGKCLNCRKKSEAAK